MLRAIIIDDEPDCVAVMRLQLERHCPTVSIVAECTGGEEGLNAIQKHEPDLVFLDIEMPRMNGFQVLEALGEVTCNIIFTTAYDQFAVKAFKYSALDYLLKPIDAQELIKAIDKAETKKRIEKQQLDLLRQHLYAPQKTNVGGTPHKLALPHQNGYIFVDIPTIIYCESDSCYTKFFLSTGENLFITKTLGDVEEALETYEFFRVHKQYLVNPQYIKKYIRGEGGYVQMTNGKEIPIARNRREAFTQSLMRL